MLDTGRNAIRLGLNYVGLYDDLAVFNRALTDAEIAAVHALQDGARALHP